MYLQMIYHKQLALRKVARGDSSKGISKGISKYVLHSFIVVWKCVN